MYDYLIRNARLLDGTGAPETRGDLAVAGGKIVALGMLGDTEATRVIDAAGRYLIPGFIDIHRHGDAALFRPGYGWAELAQGLTTVINGNCGLSLAPVEGAYQEAILRYLAPIVGELPEGEVFPTMEDYFRQVKTVPLPLNVGMLAGMGTLRANAAGFQDRSLSADQLRKLHALLEKTLADGVLGVSLGLGYAPECFYTTEELLRALTPLQDSGVVISVHMRQEGDGVVEALQEMLAVAAALRTPVEISHLKGIGRRNWRRAVPEMLTMIRQARESGLDVSCDVYPYPAGSTQLIHVLPPEFQAGGQKALTEALRTPEKRRAIRRRMEMGSDFENISLLVGFEQILATSLTCPENRCFEGQSIAEIAAARGQDPYDALFDLLAAERCAPSMIDFIAAEEDIAEILQSPFTSLISDATYPGGRLHPRVYGSVARLLETYVGKREILTLPEAVRKVTRQPADRYGLTGKGRLAVGADADLCLFHLENVHERATWQEPEQLAEGMDWVFVNGVPAIDEGRFTGKASGRAVIG
ncbi:dihydroorotase [Oscillibacter sp. PC13]|uniref:N-acyl-D-amino-acid deacylase family protein n=1 Tax=Oscillibacter sp. PC13 TaxID=1855299 RepID=UPI0008E3D84F|nr:D-aminoacylase [Oscillibacter sp. PC13]SFP51074.1 dihydroorotase [Oscillibacter sp. PC13]